MEIKVPVFALCSRYFKIWYMYHVWNATGTLRLIRETDLIQNTKFSFRDMFNFFFENLSLFFGKQIYSTSHTTKHDDTCTSNLDVLCMLHYVRVRLCFQEFCVIRSTSNPWSRMIVILSTMTLTTKHATHLHAS